MKGGQNKMSTNNVSVKLKEYYKIIKNLENELMKIRTIKDYNSAEKFEHLNKQISHYNQLITIEKSYQKWIRLEGEK
tara:strand:+ start:365 stop:595 length:231 start_codon:yes stop_codon:yes gene_type:complete